MLIREREKGFTKEDGFLCKDRQLSFLGTEEVAFDADNISKIKLFFNIFGASFSSSFMLLCDRYFLSRYSIDALNAVAVAGYLLLLFQLSSIRLTSINQVFVGRSLGNGNYQNIGIYTWQMIWVSILIQLILLPIGLFIGGFYFAQTEVESLGKMYFSIMMMGHVLFPLGATLASFQLGVGKTKALMLITIGVNVLNGVLDYFLINGIYGIIEPLGIKGAAIATLISQLLYCLILFYLFIYAPMSSSYQTKKWQFRFSFFKESVRSGTPLAFAKFFNLLLWALSMGLVAKKGGDYLILLSFGSTVWILTAAMNESLMKGLTTLFSYSIGQGNRKALIKSFKSGILVLGALFCFLGIPFLFFQKQLIQFVLKEEFSSTTMHFLHLGCCWLWILFLAEGMTFVWGGLLVSLKETFYLFKAGAISSCLTYSLYYMAFSFGSLGPDKIWLIKCPRIIFATILYGRKVMKYYSELNLLSRPNLFALKGYP